jgi:hypothetical protein
VDWKVAVTDYKPRPHYETEENRSNEQRIARIFLGHKGKPEYAFNKLPLLYKLDYAFVKPDRMVAGFAEVKCRTKQYAQCMIDQHKWETGVQLSEATGLPFYFIVEFPQNGKSVVAYIKGDRNQQFELMWNGRKDRGDWQDAGIMYIIPWENFTFIDRSTSEQTNIR